MPEPNELLSDGTLIVKCDAAVASFNKPSLEAAKDRLKTGKTYSFPQAPKKKGVKDNG